MQVVHACHTWTQVQVSFPILTHILNVSRWPMTQKRLVPFVGIANSEDQKLRSARMHLPFRFASLAGSYNLHGNSSCPRDKENFLTE